MLSDKLKVHVKDTSEKFLPILYCTTGDTKTKSSFPP